MGIGSILKEKLHKEGMTIKELARVSGVPVNTLYSITKRDSKRVETETLVSIAKALNVEPYELTPEYSDYLKHVAEQREKREQLESLIDEFYGKTDGAKALSYCTLFSDEGRKKWFSLADDLLEIKRYNQGSLEDEAERMLENPE